ncbi:MAG: desulfoferrodoxin family protein [Candidatus Saccharicenans sp.]
MKLNFVSMVGFLVIILLSASPLLANKSAVSLEGPASAKKGQQVTLKVNVAHRGNSKFHYTKNLVVLANKKEIARWTFSPSSLPEAENFSREIKLTIAEKTEVEAEARCNLHGSAGPSYLKINIQPAEKLL